MRNELNLPPPLSGMGAPDSSGQRRIAGAGAGTPETTAAERRAATDSQEPTNGRTAPGEGTA